jgi:2-keto-4-pentenoate hydratase/2-oxohepta-3-ene-1,7-dioic acid hydratase in catechol pathway
MHLYRAQTDSGPRPAVARDGELLALERCPVDDPGTEAAAREIAAGRRDAPSLGALADARLAAPWTPRQIVAIGLNYHDHIRETGMSTPKRPLVFAKFPSSVIGPDAEIVADAELTDQVDWEVELSVVVGRTMRAVATADALDHVLGYTVGNDVSARDVQFSDGQWVRAKSFDTFCPLGPAIVTPDEVGDPQALALRTRVNGEVVQDSSTAEMIFGVAELLSFCSRSFTLERGDVVMTGTPWGCGGFMDPPRALHPGDVVETAIERVGVLRNPVVAPAPGR